jgi:hypothetical protein
MPNVNSCQVLLLIFRLHVGCFRLVLWSDDQRINPFLSPGLRHLEEEHKEVTLSTDSCDNSETGTQETAKRLRTDADKARSLGGVQLGFIRAHCSAIIIRAQ